MENRINSHKSDTARAIQIAEQPTTPVDVLSKLAAHADVEVRLAVADHCNTSLETIMILAQDKNADLRYAIAENHNVKASVLCLLTEDENPFIAFRARKTLLRLCAGSNATQLSIKWKILDKRQNLKLVI